MDYQALFQAALTALSVSVAAAWFFWQRYQQLEERLRLIEAEIVGLKHLLELSRQAVQSNEESLQYLVNANRELIEHRTRRFTEQFKAVEGRLGQDIKEIKNWLDVHTEFTLRDR